ncbi:DUF58 domain-containing protein [Jiangella alba]|uniref:Uncharacterized conserved protein, DUF58 family, contains vWF domain n=1 Tax=Jiangella alba TaxID=561176 RepID=A0A1H5DI46_9ACTN|nr:DUF58 domain-containing protein [Jiangella alba]SED78534.1 Uncharacterized conserved protein, DUF58 family, contains vWF domain [Jiangella alba]
MNDALSGLTRRGWTFLAVGGGAVLAAVLAGQRDVLRVGLLLVVVPAISLMVALRSRVRLAASRSVEPPRVSVGERATVRLQLANSARIPTGVLLVEDSIPFTLGARPRFVLDHVWSRFRRDVTYSIDPVVRGRYKVGPLTVRVTDPFGMVELRRAFSDVGTLIVTPTVHQLPPVRLVGEWSGSGESRPRAIAAAGEEDATIRAYRIGDDMRRVHWRATAHHGELMVRREEQPWQSRATLLLDTRTSGHTGEGIDSSLEWSVTAAASVGVHLAERGYAVRLVTDHGGAVSTNWHDPASGPGDAKVSLLDALAVVQPQRDASIGRWPDLLSGAEAATGLLVGVFGRLTEPEAHVVAGLRQGSTAALAVVLDVMSWTSLGENSREQVRLTAGVQVLRSAGWNVIVAKRGEHLATLWERLGLQRPAVQAQATAGVSTGPEAS